MNHFISNHWASAHFASVHFSGEASEVVEIPSTGAGGNYGGRILPTLADYEKRIKKYLNEERKQLKAEEKRIKKLLIKQELEKLQAEQQEEIRHSQEIELKYLIISESLLQIKRDLAEIERKRATIKLRARIMRDDDEIMVILYG